MTTHYRSSLLWQSFGPYNGRVISSDLRRLVRSTAEYARRWSDDQDHTVAAGLLTASGELIVGMNSYHFLGGPCGEVTALSNHASSRPDDPIIAVAAVYGPTGDVISPCGKCRQIFFDINPDIRFIVRDAAGLIAQTAAELLPFAYDWRDAEQPQQLYMWEGYETLVRSGAKTQTIRVDDPFRPGPAEIVFEKANGDVLRIPATISDVRTQTRGDLTSDMAVRDGFSSLDELHVALDTHYPGLGANDVVDVVRFTVEEAES